MNSRPSPGNKAALIGFLLMLPFFALNAIVVSKLEPFYTLIRPGLHTSPAESVLLNAVLILFPIAFFITLRPMLRRGYDGKYHFYIINALLGAVILAVTVLIWGGLAQDVISCDILKIPNCD